MYYWLTSAEASVWSYHTWDSHDIPDTPAKREQQDLSLDSVDTVIHAMLMQGDVPCDHESKGGWMFVPTGLLGKEAKLDPGSVTKLGRRLGVLASTTSTTGYVGTGLLRKQRKGFLLPELSLCRERWEDHLGRTVKWPNDPDSWAPSMTEAEAEAAAAAKRAEAKEDSDARAVEDAARQGELDDETPF